MAERRPKGIILNLAAHWGGGWGQGYTSSFYIQINVIDKPSANANINIIPIHTHLNTSPIV